MSQFIYNGVELKLIKTNFVDREIRLSPDRTEYMWTDFIIDVNCIYNPGATSFPPGASPMTTDVNTRSFLMQPRRSLFFAEGGQTIVSVPVTPLNPNQTPYPAGTAFDCENGPTPLSCTIARIGSSNIFFVRYVVKASIIECGALAIISAIASSRYGRVESIDGQYRSTMVTSGKAFFRSNVLATMGQNADAFRGYIIPDPMSGYQRKLVQVALDPSGIVMEFAATDVEQFIDLGNPYVPGTAGALGIVEMGLTYSTASVPHGAVGMAGFQINATVQAYAVGTRFADMWTITQFLYRCAINKLGSIFQTGICVDISLKEDVFNFSVSFSITYQTIPSENLLNQQLQDVYLGINGFVGVPIASLPNTGGLEPQPPFSNATRGGLAYQLAVQFFATACLTNPSQVGGCDPTGLVPPDLLNYNGQCVGQLQVLLYEYLTLTPGQNKVRGGKTFRGPNPDKGGYLEYTMRNNYDTKSGIIALPVAGGAIAAPISPGGSPGGTSLYETPSPTPPPTPSPMPSPSPTGSCQTLVNLQLFQPYTILEVKWAIERYGCMVEAPDPAPTQQGYTLLRTILSPVNIELLPDTYTPIYRMSGSYVYSSSCPLDDAPVLPFAIPPWVDMSTDDEFTQIIETDYIQGVINLPDNNDQ